MKAKFTRVGKRSLSVILTLMMIVSTMLVGVVTTTAATNFTVYFEDTAVWNQVYVFLFKDNPWNDSNGVNVDGKYVVYSGMTEVGTSSSGKKIYSYEYTGTDEVSYIAFAKYDQHTYGQFHGNEVSYTSIFTDSTKTLWTPDGTNTKVNECPYYNSGSWSAYGSGSGDTKTPKYYYKGNQNNWTEKEALTVSKDGTFEYRKCTASSDHQFLLGTSSDYNAYKASKVQAGYNGTDIGKDYFTNTGETDIKCTYDTGDYYILAYYPSTEGDAPIICANTTLPETSANYKVYFGSNDDNFGTVSAKAGDTTLNTGDQVASGKTVNFTASAKEGYEVEGWYSDKTLSTKIDVAGTNTTYSTAVTAETNVYVQFKKSTTKLATPSITLDPATGIIPLGSDGSVTLTVSNHSDYPAAASVTYKLYKDSTEVTTASFTDGSCQIKEEGTYTVKAIAGNTSDYSDSDLSDAKEIKKAQAKTYYITGRFAIKNEDGTYTSTKDATLQSKPNDGFWQLSSTNIKFTYDSGSTYKLNTGLTVSELTNTNKWYFRIYDGTNTYAPSNDTSLVSSNVGTSYATETGKEKSFYFDEPTADSGIVVLYFDDSTKKFHFEIEGGKTALAAPSITINGGTSDVTLTTEADSAELTVTPPEGGYPEGLAVTYKLYNGGTYVADITGTTHSIKTGGTYTVKAYPPTGDTTYKASPDSNQVTVTDSRTPVTLNAMNGAKERKGEEKVNNAWPIRPVGKTVAEAANASSSVSAATDITDGKQYTVTKGSTVKVTTTMESTSTDEKYVYAFLVNNKYTYLASKNIINGAKTASYSAQFTIEQDTKDTEFTVVPIYYYNACAKEGEYIKLYVNTKDSSWTSVNNYCYYYTTDNGTDTKDTKESDGSWPGQPMLYDDTKEMYYTFVPKSINNQKVSGITVNATEDSKKQTYDFDDFKYINESGYDIVRLDLKEKTGDLNKTTIGAKYSDGSFTADSHPTNISAFDGKWEVFNDINGKPMSILGKEVDPNSTKKLYVVSTADHNIPGRGEFMTAWFVYEADEKGNLTHVTTACPSDFIPRLNPEDGTLKANQTDAYRAIESKGLDKAPVQIVFEAIKSYADTQQSRIDGRWYYAQSNTAVSAYAKYKTDDGTISENASYASVNGAVSVTNPKRGMTIKVVASPLAGYVFDHWSIVDKDNNILVNKLENVGSSFETTLDADIYYLANFRKATKGSLEISHGKYFGTGAKGGLGYYGLVVQVKKAGSDTWTDVDTGTDVSAGGKKVTITGLSENDQSIRIKLITKTGGLNTFRNWYTTGFNGSEIIGDPDDGAMTVDGTPTDDPFGEKGTLTYTFDTEVSKLFSDGVQKVTQMNFYSDITPTTNKYKLTYKYTDRFGNPKEYIVTGVHDDQYYIDNHNSWAPTPKLIQDNAPYIDDMYKNCNWVVQSATKDGSDATLVADHSKKKYTVIIKTDLDSAEDPTPLSIALNDYVLDAAGRFYEAPATSGGKDFKYWSIRELKISEDSEGNTVYSGGDEVARHNYRTFTRVVLENYYIEPVYGSDVSDAAFISNPQYTREQYTDADGKVVTDRVYVDFMLAYSSAVGELLRNDTVGKYKTGLLVELAQDHTLAHKKDADGNIIVTDPNYSSEYSSNIDKLKEIAKTTVAVSKYSNGENNTDKRIVYNFETNKTQFNNFNRYQYYVPFKNTSTMQLYIMKAYFYVVVDDGNGNLTTVISEKPVYFNIYDIGSKKVV